MGQQQPSSLPYWRSREANAGASAALREAAQEIDAHVEELGRLRDLRVTINVALMAACAVAGFLVGHFVGVAP